MSMERIEISRNNCNEGPWEIPGDENSPSRWGTFYDMAEYHLKNYGYSPENLVTFEFIPDNPEDVGRHNIPGTAVFHVEKK